MVAGQQTGCRARTRRLDWTGQTVRPETDSKHCGYPLTPQSRHTRLVRLLHLQRKTRRHKQLNQDNETTNLWLQEHAFIQGDVNRLRRGANLNLTGLQTAKSEQKVSVSSLPKQSSQQSGKAKYRLNQAEMSLVTEKEQDSSHGSAKKSTEKNQTSNVQKVLDNLESLRLLVKLKLLKELLKLKLNN